MQLRRLPSGKWQAIVQHAGRRRTVTGRTRGAAQQAGAELLLEMGATQPAADITVADLLAAWLSASAALSPTFLQDALRVIDRLPAEFARRRVAQVTTPVVEGLYRQLARDGWSAHRVARVHTVLSSAWTLARRYRWAGESPFTTVRKPRPVRAEISSPAPEHVTRLLDAADARMRLYLAFAASTGARRGELVGVQWADLVDGTVVLRRALSYTPTTGVVATDGKTGRAGHRVLALDPELARMLQTWRSRQVAVALAHGLPSPVWVFSHDAGLTPWRPDFVSREFARLRSTAGVPPTVRLHDLRHFVATQLLAAGIPLKAVSDRLGHRQMATTADVYAHYVPATDRASADIMANLRRPNRTG